MALTLIRLGVASAIPLAPDEAYYWIWSRSLAPGYFDHPPMVAIFIWFGTALAGETELGVRLLGPMVAALGSVLIWDTGDRLFPRRNAGLAAAVLLNAMPLFGAGAIIMTPDTPLLLFWIGALWSLARVITTGSPWWWLSVGLCAGLGLASKYTALLLILGIALWLVMAGRQWLRRPAPYLAVAMTLVIFAPVIWWNADHGWISFVKQGGRVGAWNPEHAAKFLFELIVGQMGAATPLILAMCIAGVAFAARKMLQGREPGPALLASVSAVTALAMIQHAVGDRVQANWPAIFYPAAVIAATSLTGPFWRNLRFASVILGAVLTGAIYLQALFAPLPLAVAFDPVARQTGGWSDLAYQIDATRRQANASFVATDDYALSAELAWNLPPFVTIVANGQRWATFDLFHPRLTGETGLLIVRARHDAASVDRSWDVLAPAGTAVRSARGQTIEAYHLYLVTAATPVTPVELPRPD